MSGELEQRPQEPHCESCWLPFSEVAQQTYCDWAARTGDSCPCSEIMQKEAKQ